MQLVLAVEPDRTQAETLRRIVDQLDDVQLVLVTSAYAAVVMINKRVPDLVMVGPSLGQKATEEALDHFHLASDLPEAQTLAIPLFHNSGEGSQDRGLFRRAAPRAPAVLADPDAFRAEIAVCLARAEQQRQDKGALKATVIPFQLKVREDAAPAPVETELEPELQADATLEIVAVDPAVAAAYEAVSHQEEPVALAQEAPLDEVEISLDVDSAPAGDGSIDAEVHFAELAVAHARAEARLAEELERVRTEADAQRTAELARMQTEADAQRLAEVSAARAAAEADTRTALAAELASVRSEADQALAAELSRVREETAQRLAEQLQEAEQARAVAVEEARSQAELEAARALESEVARIRTETEARLAAELRRATDEDQLRKTQDQAAEQEAARSLEAEVARIREESDARLETALSRAREEADQARRAQLQAQADAEAMREAAAREAREAAEREASLALEDAVSRARREADARLKQELDRVRADAEFAQLALQQAQMDAAAAREAAAREARAAAEADAALVHEEELTRVRLAAEARLRQELDRARQESDGERVSTRARAEAMLQAEIARARAEADSRLAAEVAAVRAEGERRRAAELAEVRAQLKDAFESARDDARSVASMSVTAEVARAETTMATTAASLAATAGKQAAVVAMRASVVTLNASVVTLKWVGRRGRAAAPVILEFVRDLPPRVLATAATLLLVAGSVAVVGVASLTRPVVPLARTASNTAAALFGAANHAVQSFDAAQRREIPAIPVVNRTIPRPKPVKELKPLATGWLAVFSRVPLDLYVAGRRIGSTNDDGHIVLAAGHYKVELVSKEFNYQGEVVLDIRAGEVTSHNFALPTGLVQVETEPGSEIWVEGELAGVAPLGPVPMPIGTRDVVVKHPDRGERRSAVTVRYNEVTTLRLSLGETVRPLQEAYPLPTQDRVGPLTP